MYLLLVPCSSAKSSASACGTDWVLSVHHGVQHMLVLMHAEEWACLIKLALDQRAAPEQQPQGLRY